MYVGYSMMSLQTVFLAGLTLICCAWSSPTEIYTPTSSNDINACSIMPFVIAERMHAAKKYLNAFEVVRQKTADQIAEGGLLASGQAVGELKKDLRETIGRGAEEKGAGNCEQFEEMVRLMAGQYGGFEGHVVGLGAEEFGFEMQDVGISGGDDVGS
jgi:hypothetical protein